MDTLRLDRIEKKLDDSALISARIEERLIASTQRVDRLEFRADEQESDLDTLRSTVMQNSGVVRTGERFFWMLCTGAVSFLVYYFK